MKNQQSNYPPNVNLEEIGVIGNEDLPPLPKLSESILGDSIKKTVVKVCDGFDVKDILDKLL